MILAVDDVMKLPEFAVQNEKVIEEKLNAAELMIRAYTNPYFVGSFNETEHRLEDGYTGGVFTLDGWSRGSKLPLAEINDKLKKVFEDLRAVQEGTAFFITYWNGLMIPTGEEDLFRITITLNTNEWKGA